MDQTAIAEEKNQEAEHFAITPGPTSWVTFQHADDFIRCSGAGFIRGREVSLNFADRAETTAASIAQW